MSRFMFDTNAVRHILNGEPKLVGRFLAHRPTAFCISVVTEAEMLFGAARHPGATKLRERVQAAIATFAVLPWTSSVAASYADLRADLQRVGKPLAPLDMMIAAHAVEQRTILITNDKALLATPGLSTEDWLAA